MLQSYCATNCYATRFLSALCCLQGDIFSWYACAYFIKTTPHSAPFTNFWLWMKRAQVLNWPACSPDLSPIMSGVFWSAKCDCVDPVQWPTLRRFCRKNGKKITREKLYHLLSSFLKRILSVVERNGIITQWATFFSNVLQQPKLEDIFMSKIILKNR